MLRGEDNDKGKDKKKDKKDDDQGSNIAVSDTLNLKKSDILTFSSYTPDKKYKSVSY